MPPLTFQAQKKLHEPVKLQKNYFKSALLNNNITERTESSKNENDNQIKENPRKTMKIIETCYFMKKIETKNADLLQAFQVSVNKIAGDQKNSVRCFSFIHCFRCFAHSFGYIRWKHIET